MRLAGLGFALALGAAIPASAQAPVSAQPLAQGEVLLEVNALGYVTSRADRAFLSVYVTADGADAPAARRATEARLARAVAAVRAAGVAAGDIDAGRVTTSVNYSDMSPEMAIALARRDAARPVPVPESSDGTTPARTMTATGNASLAITIRDVGRVEAVRDVLSANEVESYTAPEYRLIENVAQRREARAQAMRKARADADSYAASLNMRVVRVVRVSERIGLGGLGLIVSESDTVGSLFSRAWRRGAEVDTIVAVGVDFAMVPQ